MHTICICQDRSLPFYFLL